MLRLIEAAGVGFNKSGKELGRHLQNEPAFQRIVDDVQASLEDEPLLRETLHSMVAAQE